MAVVKAPLLAHVDDRELAARPQPLAQLRRRDVAGHPLPSSGTAPSVCPNSRQASKNLTVATSPTIRSEIQRKSGFFATGRPYRRVWRAVVSKGYETKFAT